MTEKEEYEITNNKIIKAIEERYMKVFRKEVKKFQIVLVGYNASKYKSLQVFKKYGWKLFSPIIGSEWMNCLFKYKISSKCGICINLAKNLKTGILKSDPNMTWTEYMEIYVDRTDEIFSLIEQGMKRIYLGLHTFGNDSLKIIVNRTEDGEYKLMISDSQN